MSELLRVSGLCKRHSRDAGLWREGRVVQALLDVDLALAAGATLALVGESGGGKSTLARCVAGLEPADAGEIWFDGQDLSRLTGRELKRARRPIQLIFQDSAQALNPRFSAAAVVEEPLLLAGVARDGRRERALGLMQAVGLPRAWATRGPLELSGGQRQRLAIARALAAEPRLLVLDEALAGLDLLVQAQIVNLLVELQEARALAYLYVSHDLALMARLADEVAVLERGRIVERGTPAQVLGAPRHPYTQALVASARRPAARA
ncbi:MAG: ABC transporter ATP-binding protein [Vicinamibacteria bacterium]